MNIEQEKVKLKEVKQHLKKVEEDNQDVTEQLRSLQQAKSKTDDQLQQKVWLLSVYNHCFHPLSFYLTQYPLPVPPNHLFEAYSISDFIFNKWFHIQ